MLRPKTAKILVMFVSGNIVLGVIVWTTVGWARAFV